MVKIIFKKNGKADRIVEADEGATAMEAAIKNDIGEILADCGGALSCATCHVHVSEQWRDKVGEAGPDELAMLEMAVDPEENSRLSCQIHLTPDLDGLELILPKSQL